MRENRRVVLFAHFSNQSSIVERRKKRIGRIERSQEIAKAFKQRDFENLKKQNKKCFFAETKNLLAKR